MAIVVMGASVGGVGAYRAVLGALPASFPAPICIVQHIGAHPTELPALLRSVTALAVETARHGAALRPGCIYVAPPDRHVRVTATHLEVLRGPRENFSRPAIDPLFRSAAEAFGPDVVGVVLTGRLNDGTAGLYEIKRRGGVAVVQDPATAESPEMPRSVLAHVAVDHCVPLDAMAACLQHLVVQSRAAPAFPAEVRAMSSTAFDSPVALTCPDCGGAMRRDDVGTLAVFVCHTRHRFTIDALADGERRGVEGAAEALVRRLNEHVELCATLERIATDPLEAQRWRDAGQRAVLQRDAVSTLFSADGAELASTA